MRAPVGCRAGSKCRPGPARAAALAWSSLAVAGLCSACTLVEIQSADGQVRIERHLGFVSIELPPEIASRVVHLKGVGLVSIGFATTLGYADTTLVTLGTECRLLVWIDEAQQIDQLHRVLPDTGDLCVVTESKLEGRKI